MIRISKQYIDGIRNATSAGELAPMLQGAVELEHATIPPYLTALFTVKAPSGAAVRNIIRSVVVEEMLHLTIASNLMIALGGQPAINTPHFVPSYPGNLPMGIDGHLTVRLRKCSLEQIHDIFMGIEEPENPINIPVIHALTAGDEEFGTIGQFYLALAEKIESLGDDAFGGHEGRQVIASKWFPDPAEMFAITDVKTAVRAINVIIDQGEGTSTNPFDGSGEPAHYYRFEEIVNGCMLVQRPGETPPYAYAGDPVPFDEDSVWDMDDDPKAAKYKVGSTSRRMADQFNFNYTMLLNSLHNAFNGDPTQLDHAMGLMFELRLLAQQVLATPAEWADPNVTAHKQTGLTYEYQPVNV